MHFQSRFGHLGVFTRAELEKAGYSGWQIRHCDAHLGLRRVRQGIYVDPDSVGDPWMRNAAVLVAAGGVDAALSRQAAAALYELDGFDSGRVPLTASVHRGSVGADPAFHLRASLEAPEKQQTLPVTAAGQTLLELGAELIPRPGCAAATRVLPPQDLVELGVEAAVRKKLVTIEGLEDLVARTGSRRAGRATLRAVLARRPKGAAATESYLETRGIQVLRDGGLQCFERQRELRDRGSFLGRVDLFAEPRTVVEFDGREAHEPRHDADRARWTRLQGAGYLVAVFTFHHVEFEPEFVLAETRKILQLAAA